MKRVSVGEIQALFREYGADAWLELVLRHGKTFRVQHLVVTCDTRLVEQLMLDPVHTSIAPPRIGGSSVSRRARMAWCFSKVRGLKSSAVRWRPPSRATASHKLLT